MHEGKNIVFFDGVCGLCNRTVDFLIARDSQRKLCYAPLQGTTAATMLNLPPNSQLASIILWHNNQLYYQSTAVLYALKIIGGIWGGLGLLGLGIPQFLRDPIYTWIARNRYRWFGKRDSCRVPTPIDRQFFLE